ncbi:MAG: hypothetical protein V1718_05855, partial [archaeon]
MNNTNPTGTGTLTTTNTASGIQPPIIDNNANPTSTKANTEPTISNYTASSAIDNTPTINTDQAINYTMTTSSTPSPDQGRIGSEITPQYTGKEILPVPSTTLYSDSIIKKDTKPQNTIPDYNLTGTIPVHPSTAPPNIQNIYLKPELPPSLNYTGKATQFQKKYIEPETGELSIKDLYKQALDKYKIKKHEMSLKEFIEILTDSIDKETEDTQYISAIEIALKYMSGPINPHNTDLYALVTGDNTDFEDYKQEAEAYLEFFNMADITYKDEKLTKIIDTGSVELMRHVSAITPEIRDYLIGLDKDITTYIENSNIKEAEQVDNAILRYMESSTIP